METEVISLLSELSNSSPVRRLSIRNRGLTKKYSSLSTPASREQSPSSSKRYKRLLSTSEDKESDEDRDTYPDLSPEEKKFNRRLLEKLRLEMKNFATIGPCTCVYCFAEGQTGSKCPQSL